MGFIDGSLAQAQDGSLKAEIGGFLLDKNKEIIFLFSGPSSAKSPMEAEVHALHFLIQKIINSDLTDTHILIASDSLELVTACNNDIQNLNEDIHLIKEFLKLKQGVKVAHINRRFNIEADRLGKKGRLRSNVLEGWTH